MDGLLKTLIKPDWDDNPKRSEILHAANLLHIGEFQLIQLSYKSWYNEDLPEDKINKIFSEYMVTGIIPIWVAYYAQDILKLNKGPLTDEHLSIIYKEIISSCLSLETDLKVSFLARKELSRLKILPVSNQLSQPGMAILKELKLWQQYLISNFLVARWVML